MPCCCLYTSMPCLSMAQMSLSLSLKRDRGGDSEDSPKAEPTFAYCPKAMNLQTTTSKPHLSPKKCQHP